ncbi:MAG TPA: OsmC family protein [Thermoplasmata archaeon]
MSEGTDRKLGQTSAPLGVTGNELEDEIKNGVNLTKYREFIEAVKQEPVSGLKRLQVEGEWLSDGLAPHFSAFLDAESGKVRVEFDEPQFLGGGFKAPNPNQYCLAGAVACYASSFSKWAAMSGINIRRLAINAAANIDMSKSLGVSENPPVEAIEYEVIVDSDATTEELQRIKELADERCPGVYCLTHALKLDIKLRRIEK